MKFLLKVLIGLPFILFALVHLTISWLWNRNNSYVDLSDRIINEYPDSVGFYLLLGFILWCLFFIAIF